MSATAAQVVVQELIQWLEREDYNRFTEVQRLEVETRIWEYAKWCSSGGGGVSGFKPQIPYSGSPPESTWWDALSDMSDEDAMRIHDAIKGLEDQQAAVIKRVYIWGQCLERARSAMCIRRDDFYDLRKKALRKISESLKISIDWGPISS